MKTNVLLLLTTYCFISACEPSPQEKQKTEVQRLLERDSFSRATYGESADQHIKHETQKIISKAMLDTIGVYKAPVKVLVARIVKKEYSTYRSVHLTYKNVSGKMISGIKFKWYGVNAFNEPADLGSTFAEGFGGGFTDDSLKPGRTGDGTWDVLSRDAKKIKVAWPYEVSFDDGTSWKLRP
jgi:hypothetical protein